MLPITQITTSIKSENKADRRARDLPGTSFLNKALLTKQTKNYRGPLARLDCNIGTTIGLSPVQLLQSFSATWPTLGTRFSSFALSHPDLCREQGGSPGQDPGKTGDGGEAEWAGGLVMPSGEYLRGASCHGCLPSPGRPNEQQLSEGWRPGWRGGCRRRRRPSGWPVLWARLGQGRILGTCSSI